MTTSLTRHASKKASPTLNINNKIFSCNNFVESEFDQTTNYGLLYAEENSVIEEIGHFEYLAGSSEQENTLTTYYTEGTPLHTPLYFSTSTSTSDLLKIDDIRISNILRPEPKDYFIAYQTSEVHRDKIEKSKEFKSPKGFMELENQNKECENTNLEKFLHDDLLDLDDKSDDERLESVINVTPSQSPVELDEKDKEGKIVTFGAEQSPLMFSRSSSLESLSYEQQSLHDDHSSIISDFSRRTSEAVSPSELPDSPAQLTPHSTKDKKLVKKKSQLKEKIQSLESQPVVNNLKNSIFEDNLAVFKEESTPIKLQSVAESSLSSLTIDEDEIDDNRQMKSNNAVAMEASKTASSKTDDLNSIPISEKEKTNDIVEEDKDKDTADLSKDEEKILGEHIRKGIAKVTRQNISDVSSLHLHANGEDASKDNADLLEEDSELTAEEEKLLDECIRRGIAKVTRKNIDEITSLNLRHSFSTIKKIEKDEE